MGEHYNSWMLWYLLSTIYTLIIVYFLLKNHFKMEKIVLLGLMIITIGFLLNSLASYNGELPKILSNLRLFMLSTIYNGRIFTGMFYIPFGMLLAYRKNVFQI